MSTGEVVDLPVQRIKPGPAVRSERIDIDHARNLIPALDDCPPIVVREVGDGYELVDGQHRLSASKFAERKTVRAVVVALSDDEAYVAGVEANNGHGKPLTLAERKKAAVGIAKRYPDWSDRAIAAKCALSDKTVGKIRPRPTAEDPQLDGKRAGADGKARPASKAEQQAQRERIAALLVEHPDWSLHRIAEESGASPMTVASVRSKLQESPAPPAEGPPVETGPDEDPTPGDDHPEPEAAPVRPQLGVVPDREGEPEPTVGDLLDWCPSPGSWSTDKAFTASNAARDFARLMDRRMFRDAEAEDIAGCCPLERRRQAAFAARVMATAWSDLADELEAPARPAVEV